jgi:hypothetical protein
MYAERVRLGILDLICERCEVKVFIAVDIRLVLLLSLSSAANGFSAALVKLPAGQFPAERPSRSASPLQSYFRASEECSDYEAIEKEF